MELPANVKKWKDHSEEAQVRIYRELAKMHSTTRGLDIFHLQSVI